MSARTGAAFVDSQRDAFSRRPERDDYNYLMSLHTIRTDSLFRLFPVVCTKGKSEKALQ
jgi:hypothetical protein